jgi:histidyl-tRNA synthetase
VRAFIGNSQWTREPVTKWYYLGPMFRHERAQRGRLRQFHQLGAEVFGVAEPTGDAEMIAMLCNILGEIGIPRGSFITTINSLGEPEERPAYREALVTYLRAHEAQLDDDSRRRLELNPLRVLDSKSPEVQALVASAPVILDHLGEASRARFARVQQTLTALGVGFEIDPRLVRGLDYYTSTIFEIKVTAGELGAQNTVCGGGRYDRLVESLGGPKTPAMGFGLGLERALLAMPDAAADGAGFEPGLQVFIATLDAAALEYALPIGHRLRLAGIRTEIEHRGGSLKSQLKRADKLRARLALIVGETEVATRRLQVKDLAAGQQHEVAEADLLPRLHALLD